MTDRLDAETARQLTEADHVRSMTESDGWKSVKGKLDQRIIDLQNIHNLDTATPDAMVVDMKARMIAVKLLFDWLKEDVYGFIEQQEATQKRAVEKAVDEFIERT